MSGSPRKTPLYEAHLAAGAKVVDFAGWAMPVQYSSIKEEHAAVRNAAGIFDVSHMGEVEISGPGAEEACARLFTNDTRTLEPGRACYSLLVDDEGRVLDDVIVYRLAAERFLVCVNASNADKDFAWLARHEEAGTSIRDLSAATALLAVQGPKAGAVLAAAGVGLNGVARFGVRETAVRSVDVTIARTGYTGEDGYEVFCPAKSAPDLWDALLEAGRPHAIRPVGLGARDTLRLEAALPLYGHELGPEITPWEARVGWAVKLNRPEMKGYAALCAQKETGARRRLIGLRMERGIARHGYPVHAKGIPQGVVTSGSYGPSLDAAVALALVNASAIDADIAVEIRGRECAASVVKLPFYTAA